MPRRRKFPQLYPIFLIYSYLSPTIFLSDCLQRSSYLRLWRTITLSHSAFSDADITTSSRFHAVAYDIKVSDQIHSIDYITHWHSIHSHANHSPTGAYSAESHLPVRGRNAHFSYGDNTPTFPNLRDFQIRSQS